MRRTIADSPRLRCGRGSNPRPLAWQASILTNWTTAPLLVAPFGLRVQRYDVFPKLPNVWQRKLKLFFIMPNFPPLCLCAVDVVLRSSRDHWWHRCAWYSQIAVYINYLCQSVCSCHLWAIFHVYICRLGKIYYLCFLNSVATEVVWGRILPKKVLLKLSSDVKFSQSLK